MRKTLIIVLAAFIFFAFALPALAVTGFSAQRNPDGSVTLTWTGDASGKKLTVEREDPSGWRPVAEVPQIDGAYTDREAPPRETVKYRLHYGVGAFTEAIAAPPYQPPGGNQPGQENQPGQVGQNINFPDNGIYDQRHLVVIDLWYNTLLLLSGVLMFLVIVRSGYQHIRSGVSPGERADFIETVQMCIVAVAVIALTPTFIKVLIDINSGLVALFGNVVQKIGYATGGGQSQVPGASLFANILATPFQAVIDIVNGIFGLKDLDQLIFNGRISCLGTMHNLVPSNPFANTLLEFALVGFNFYFNAIYTLRRYTVIATWIATPLIVWIWVFTKNRQVMEIWLAEIISTIFMQTFHALSFGVLLSVIGAGNQVAGGALAGVGIEELAEGFKKIGLWVASFGGAVSVLALVLLGYRLATAGGGDKKVAEIKEGMGKVFIGLLILGLSLMIAGFLASLLNGSWL